MEVTIETIYHTIQDMDRRLNEKIDSKFEKLSNDHAKLSETVIRLDGRVDQVETRINGFQNEFGYLKWVFGAFMVALIVVIVRWIISPDLIKLFSN